MARAKRKFRTPAARSAPREEQYADPEETRRPPHFGEREPTLHIVTEKTRLLPSLFTQGVIDGICLALGERTVEKIEDRAGREAPQYMHGALVGAAHVGKRSMEPLTDDPAERQAGRFLFRVMRRFPLGLQGKRKNYLEEQCMRRFAVGGRSFERIRDWAIQRTRAGDEYKRPGPRGPHKRERRR